MPNLRLNGMVGGQADVKTAAYPFESMHPAAAMALGPAFYPSSAVSY